MNKKWKKNQTLEKKCRRSFLSIFLLLLPLNQFIKNTIDFVFVCIILGLAGQLDERSAN